MVQRQVVGGVRKVWNEVGGGGEGGYRGHGAKTGVGGVHNVWNEVGGEVAGFHLGNLAAGSS